VNYNELPEMTVAEFEAKAEEAGNGEGAMWWHFEVRE